MRGLVVFGQGYSRLFSPFSLSTITSWNRVFVRCKAGRDSARCRFLAIGAVCGGAERRPKKRYRITQEYARRLNETVQELEKTNEILQVESGERKRAEEELQRSQAYLAEAQRLSNTGSFGWKVSTGEIVWSEETFRIFQYERTTTPTVGLILQHVHPEDASLVRQTIERASQEGKDFDLEHRLLMPDGSVKHVHIVARALSDESGSIEFVGAVMDVTAAKQVEQTLRENKAYLAEAQRLTHTGSWAWNVARRENVHWSQEQYRLFGLDPESDSPSFDVAYQRIHPEDRATFDNAVERAIRERSDFEVDFRTVLPDGSTKYLRSVGHPVFSASGELVEFVGTGMDITEQRRPKKSASDCASLRRILRTSAG